jgi:uncharacterized membrane protein
MTWVSTITEAVALSAVLAIPLTAQGTFTPIGRSGSRATGISGDGRIIVGSYASGGRAWRWSESEGYQDLGGNAPQVTEARISRDGKTIVYSDRDAQGFISAAIWQGGQSWRTLGGVPGGVPGGYQGRELSTSYGVSGDGSVIVGLAWMKDRSAAFRWDSSAGMVSLGSLRGESGRASMISADGHVIGGWDRSLDGAGDRSAVIWWNGLERLLHPFSWMSEVIASNEAGTVLVGRGHPANFGHGFRWLAGDGKADDLGAIIPPYYNFDRFDPNISTGLGVTDDGSIVVGTSGSAPVEAMVWTPATKIVPLARYLMDRGIQGGFEKWIILFEAAVINPDGQVIAGSGINPDGVQQAFVVRFEKSR